MIQPQDMMKLLKSDEGIEELMQQPVYENAYGVHSQAELLADVINIYRMDAKRLGQLHGVDIEIEKIHPDKTAWAMSEMVNGHTEPIVSIFNGIEDLHHEIMAEMMDDEEFTAYLDFKEAQLFTVSDQELSDEERAAEVEAAADDSEVVDDLDVDVDDEPIVEVAEDAADAEPDTEADDPEPSEEAES